MGRMKKVKEEVKETGRKEIAYAKNGIPAYSFFGQLIQVG